MKGRKPLYNPDTLKVGEKIALNDNNKEFAYQYAYAFRRKCKGKRFEKVIENDQVFIQRTI